MNYQVMTEHDQGYMAYGYIDERETALNSVAWREGFNKAKRDEIRAKQKEQRNEHASSN